MFKLFRTAQDFLGLSPPDPDRAPPTPTIPPAVAYYTQAMPGAGASDSYTAASAAVVRAGNDQSFRGGGAPAAYTGSRVFHPPYMRLADVAFAGVDRSQRTWRNLNVPPPPTADGHPSPDWNPFAPNKWPLQAYTALRTAVFAKPRGPSLKSTVD